MLHVMPAWNAKSGRSAAFWRLSAATLDVAVLARGVGEPLITACAGVEARWTAGGGGPAVGLSELAAAVDAGRLRHVAALGDEYCALADSARAEEAESGEHRFGASIRDTGAPGAQRVSAPVAGVEPYVCTADAQVVGSVCRRFEAAGLRLERLDCAPCARFALAAFLGAPLAVGQAGLAGAGATVAPDWQGARQAGQADPLAAVSVAPECEASAAELGARLAVPVGLALAWFGYVDPLGVADALARSAGAAGLGG